MKVLLNHFRVHGAVHAIWVIAVLIFVIAALILMRPNGNAVGEYIAFAASIASLALAIVAIGQSLIANQSFSETVGVLRSSGVNLEQTARNIADTSAALSQQAERMVGEISGLPPAFREISAKIDALRTPQAESDQSLKDAEKVGKPGNRLLENSSVDGVTIGLYVLARSIETKKIIETRAIFPPKTEWDYFVAGVLHTIRTAEPLGIKLSFTRDGARFLFTVQEAGTFDHASVTKSLESFREGALFEKKELVDTYFASDEA